MRTGDYESDPNDPNGGGFGDADPGRAAFGDADPEDAWDDGDAPDVKLAILERVAEDIHDRLEERSLRRRLDALRLVDKLDRVPEVDRERLRRIRQSLEDL